MRWILPGLMLIASLLYARPFEHKEYHFPVIGKLSEQEREEAMGFIKKYGGDLRLRILEGLKWSAPLEYEHHLRRSLMKKRDLERLMETNESLYHSLLEILELERRSFDLAEKYRDTESEEEREVIKGELREILSRGFDLKQNERGERIKNLEQEITKLKNELDDRAENKDEIVKRRLESLLGEDRYLEW